MPTMRMRLKTARTLCTLHRMKNSPFSVDEALIESARRQATLENTTLHELFRAWLEQYVVD